MKYVCDAPDGKTWFQFETEAEAGRESALMDHAVAKYFQRERTKAAQSYKPASRTSFEQNIGPESHIRRQNAAAQFVQGNHIGSPLRTSAGWWRNLSGHICEPDKLQRLDLTSMCFERCGMVSDVVAIFCRSLTSTPERLPSSSTLRRTSTTSACDSCLSASATRKASRTFQLYISLQLIATVALPI